MRLMYSLKINRNIHRKFRIKPYQNLTRVTTWICINKTKEETLKVYLQSKKNRASGRAFISPHLQLATAPHLRQRGEKHSNRAHTKWYSKNDIPWTNHHGSSWERWWSTWSWSPSPWPESPPRILVLVTMARVAADLSPTGCRRKERATLSTSFL